MRIEYEVKLDFKDVLIKPKRNKFKSRSEVDLVRTYTFLNSKAVYTGIPIIASNMDTIGTFEMAIALKKHNLLTAIHKHYTFEEWKTFAAEHSDVLQNIALTSGSSETDFEKLKLILEHIPQIKFLCLDVANGYAEQFVEFVRQVRQAFSDRTIIAGNVVSSEMVEELLLSGADIVKVGIGPGSVCTTRKQTGIGYPQLSAVIECADAAHGLGGHIISDGGCVCPGDVCKAFGAGADFTMLGGMLSGHDECGGQTQVDENGNKYKIFYGASSATAMAKYSGGVASYKSPEGKTVRIPHRGNVDGTILEILGGLRSACTYTGSLKLKELPKRTTFIRVTQQLNEVYRQNEISSQANLTK